MKKIIFVTLAFLLLGFGLPKIAFGIGQMAETIVIKDVLRGSEITDTLILFNSGDREVIYQLKGEGEIADWVSFYQIDDTNLENPVTEVLIPAKSRVKATVKFTIPEDTPNGEYTGEVAIVTAPTKSEEGDKMAINVFQRIGRKVSITVTDEEILKFETTIIPLRYAVEKNQPLKIKIIHNNQGNVSIKPDIQLQISKKGGKIFNAIFPYPEDEKPVKPLERKILSSLIEWQTAGREDGEYTAEVKTLLNGKTMEKDSFHFTVGVVDAGGSNKILNCIARIGGGNLVLGWFIIGGFFIALSMLLPFANKKKGIWKRKKKEN